MTRESHSKQIEHLALKVIRARPNRSQGLDYRAGTVQANLQADALLIRNRKKMVDDLKAWFRRIPVHAGDVRQEVKRTGWVFFQQNARFADIAPIDINRHLVAIKLHPLHGVALPAKQPRYRRMILQLFDIGDRRRQWHYRRSPPAPVSPQSSTPFFHT